MENLKKYIQNFTNLSEKSWIILNDCLTELQVKKGTYLLKENEVCNSVYFISSGYCKSFYNKDKELALKIEVTNKERTEECNRFLEKYTRTYTNPKSKTASSNLVAVAKIVENLKATAVEIRNVARTVLCYE